MSLLDDAGRKRALKQDGDQANLRRAHLTGDPSGQLYYSSRMSTGNYCLGRLSCPVSFVVGIVGTACIILATEPFRPKFVYPNAPNSTAPGIWSRAGFRPFKSLWLCVVVTHIYLQ